MKNSGVGERMIPISEAVVYAGIKQRDLKRMADQREVPAIKISDDWYFYQSMLTLHFRHQMTLNVVHGGDKWEYTGSKTETEAKPPMSPSRLKAQRECEKALGLTQKPKTQSSSQGNITSIESGKFGENDASTSDQNDIGRMQ